jgi:hypothetical protein
VRIEAPNARNPGLNSGHIETHFGLLREQRSYQLSVIRKIGKALKKTYEALVVG